MSEVKWIKLATNIFDNRKIKQIETLPESDAIIVMWIKLLCLAGNINDNGCIYFTKEIPYTEQMLSTQFNMPLSTVQLALTTFEQFGMVEVVDNIMMISNWSKYQSVEKMNDLKEYNRIKQRESRERRKLLQCSNVNDMSMTVNDNVNLDIDKKEDKNRLDKNTSKAKRFTKPTINDIQQYCIERNNTVDAKRFFDWYESNGWKVGKNPMKDWKAAVRTWERSNTIYKSDIKKGITPQWMEEEQNEDDQEDVEELKKQILDWRK